MVVRKLAKIEDARPPRANPLEGESLRSAVELSELCLRLRPITPPRGVLRFTSVEASRAHRRQWELGSLPS
jgi:hypothetical protein